MKNTQTKITKKKTKKMTSELKPQKCTCGCLRKKPVILLYSGGVDSIVCLNRLVKKGIVPLLWYFKEKDFKYARQVRRTAKLLSPKSMFLSFDVKEYDAFWTPQRGCPKEKRYGINFRKGKALYPMDFAKIVVVGYHKYMNRGPIRGICFKGVCRHIPRGQKEFIEWSRRLRLSLRFPLARYTPHQIEAEFAKLPENIRRLVVTDTRGYIEEGVFSEP